MTKNDIINAAFHVWGRDFYKRTSLSSLAKELKVSKPALYRHFLSKEDLNKAMMNQFYDDFSAYIRSGFESAADIEDAEEGFFVIFKAIANYYARNCYMLIFSLMNAYERKLNREAAHEEFKKRGINTDIIRNKFEKKYEYRPRLLQLVFTTLVFYIGSFHKNHDSMANPPAENQINDLIASIYNDIKQGLGFSKEKVSSINHEKLIKLVQNKMIKEPREPHHPIDELFKAVAKAVAEAGPWNASMEMVAKNMGLSKSSLYGHFKNKKDMLHRLFITEFKRIIEFAHLGMSFSEEKHEKLYLGIYSIAVYLNSRPEILITIDWIRTRRLDFEKNRSVTTNKNMEVYGLFEDIKLESIKSQWILFLLVNILVNTDSKKDNNISVLDMDNINILYRFITLGLGGFVK